MRSSKQVHFNKLEVAQKKVIRCIESAHYLAHSSPMFKRLHMLKIPDLHELYTAKQMHLYNKDSLPTPLKELFIRNSHNHSYETRQRALPRLNKFKLSIASKSFKVVGPKLWSSMESSVLNISNTNIFVNHYKRLLLNKY